MKDGRARHLTVAVPSRRSKIVCDTCIGGRLAEAKPNDATVATVKISHKVCRWYVCKNLNFLPYNFT